MDHCGGGGPPWWWCHDDHCCGGGRRGNYLLEDCPSDFAKVVVVVEVMPW